MESGSCQGKKINTWISESAPPGTNKEFPRTQSHKINKWGNLPHLCPYGLKFSCLRFSHSDRKRKAGKGKMQIAVGGRVSNLRYYITVRDGCSTGLLTHSCVIVWIYTLFWHVQLWIKSLAPNNQNFFFFPVRGEKHIIVNVSHRFTNHSYFTFTILAFIRNQWRAKWEIVSGDN